MAKYNIKRRHSKTLDLSTGIRYRPLSRRLDFGGVLDYNGKEKGLGWNKASGDALKSSFSDVGNAISSVGSVVGGVTSIVDSAMKNAQIADTTGIESDIQELKDETFSEATDSNSLLDAYNNINFQKDDYTMRDVRGVSGGEMAMNTISAIGSGAAAGASVGGPWGAVAGAAVGLGSSLAGIFTGNSKARRKAEMLNAAARDANNRAIDTFDYQANSVMKDNARNALMAAYAKDGGAIHIKKKNRGKFTASAKRAGMGVQEFARHVLANKDKYSPTLVKRANFARNASKWKHDEGGPLNVEWFWNEGAFNLPSTKDNYVQVEPKINFNNISTTRDRAYNSDYISYIYDKLKGTYLGDKQIAAIIGSIIEESGGNPLISSDTGKYTGLLQWDNTRYSPQFGDVYKEIDNQIQYILRSITNTSDGKSWTHGGKGSGYSSLKEPYDKFYDDKASVEEITRAFNLGYVRPHGKHDSASNRSKVAEQVYSLIKNSRGTNKEAVNALNKAEESNADFVKRLRDGNRDSIPDWENPNKISTHKMGWAEDDYGAFIYPTVSGTSGELVDYSRVPYSPSAAIDVALENKDYVRMTPEEATWFTENYKNYYPKFNTYAMGGNLGHGTDWNTGLIKVDEGGSHETNPYEGVPMGIAPDGQPNLVEEGEVIFNDYVFSNRLHPSEKELEKANLPKRYKGHTFALIAEDMSKESSERPNDPISQRGLQDSLGKLALLQEQQRMEKGKKGTQQMMALGGRKYSGLVSLEDDPYEGSKEQALDEAELDWLAKQDPQLWEELQAIGSTPDKSLPTYLRYAPALGSALGALTSVIQKPDYSNSDLILGIANNLSRDKVRYRPISNYLTYKPLDRNYYLNSLQRQAAATRAALRNSGINPGQVMAGLLAADYNAQNAVGDTLMKMDMYNEQQRQAVEQFNRGTNQYNSQAAMTADAQNAQIAQNRDRLRSSLMTQAAQMREAADTALEATRSANLTNFFDNLGGIGQDNMAQNWRNRLIDVGYFGAGSDRIVGKNGGRLLTKKNRRRK